MDALLEYLLPKGQIGPRQPRLRLRLPKSGNPARADRRERAIWYIIDGKPLLSTGFAKSEVGKAEKALWIYKIKKMAACLAERERSGPPRDGRPA